MDYVSKEQWNMIFTHTGEAIIFLNDQGIIESMNPASEELTGYLLQDAVGKHVDEIFQISTQDSSLSPATALLNPEQRNKKAKYLEVQLKRREGDLVWISCSFTQIHADQYGDEKMVIFARNIDDAKKVEQMRSDFISIASHELRTPLTVISGYLSLLLASKVGKLAQPQVDFIKQIYDDTQSLSSLVEDLLDVSRLDSGKFKLHKSPLIFSDLIKKTIDSLADKAIERNITIVYNSSNKEVPPFYGDKAKIRQVLTNLIDNAIKYTNPSGKIKVGFKVTETDFVITIVDNGYGIEKKDLPHIFDRFYRAESKLLDRVTGAGLGLYISKTIVDMHEGQIEVESAIDKGTTFIMTFPRNTMFEKGQAVQVQEKAPNAFAQFISNFLHGKRRKDYSYD